MTGIKMLLKCYYDDMFYPDQIIKLLVSKLKYTDLYFQGLKLQNAIFKIKDYMSTFYHYAEK